jgi:Mrp family chromosome partitioning ATPase
MATGDIEITSVPEDSDLGSTGPEPGTALSTYVVPRTAPKASPLAPKDREPLIKATLRKRWWLLGICGIVALGPAYFVAHQFATETFHIKGELEYHGLPEMTKTNAYTMEPVEAHAELIQSPAFLLTVIEKRNMAHELDVLGLTNSLDVSADGKSKMITMLLASSDLAKGKELLDDLMDMYVQRAVEDRRTRATDHVRHAEEELFRAEANEENCRKLLRNFNEKMVGTEFEQVQIPDTLRQYTTALNAAVLAQTTFKTQIQEYNATRTEQVKDLNRKMVESKLNNVKTHLEKYDPGSPPHVQLDRLKRELEALAKKSATFDSPVKYKEDIDGIGKNLTSFAWLNQYITPDMSDQSNQIDKITEEGKRADLMLKTRNDEVKDLTAKIDDAKKKLEAANNALRPQLEERKAFLDDLAGATQNKQVVRAQLQALRQIKATPVKELSIVCKATWDGKPTTTFKKLFALSFIGVGLVLVAPVFGAEYYLSRESAADETARRFGLPLLSRGALSSRLNRRKTGEFSLARTNDDGEDSLRLLALRIQQSLRRPGAVIVFSPLEHDESPISLICKLAVCFAEREELVLVVDAGGTLAESRSILSSLFRGTPHRTPEGKPLDPTLVDGSAAEAQMATFGISDFLCNEDLEIGDLVLHTKYTRVDCIHGGVCPPPREGLASRRITDLLELSRGRYSMILVAGPSTKNQTDVQLLAARADGMLFTVSPSTPISNRGHEVIQDLIDLDAPVMGLIG